MIENASGGYIYYSPANLFITIYSIQYKYIIEIKITKKKKTISCGEGDNQKRNGTIPGMSPLIKI